MKTIRQKAFFRQRVTREIEKGGAVATTAIRYQICRTSIYRWLKRYDGTVESLYERSHRPKYHPNQHTAEKLRLIRRVWSHNKGLGLVCLHMVLAGKHGYVRSVSSLNRMMRKLGIGRKNSGRRNIYLNHIIPRKYLEKCLVKGIAISVYSS